MVEKHQNIELNNSKKFDSFTRMTLKIKSIIKDNALAFFIECASWR